MPKPEDQHSILVAGGLQAFVYFWVVISTKILQTFFFLIYLPHIINYTITITKRYKNVESNGEEA